MSYRLANSNYLPVDLNHWTELNKFYRQTVGTANKESVTYVFTFSSVMKSYMYFGKNEERRTKAILAPKMKQREHS